MHATSCVINKMKYLLSKIEACKKNRTISFDPAPNGMWIYNYNILLFECIFLFCGCLCVCVCVCPFCSINQKSGTMPKCKSTCSTVCFMGLVYTLWLQLLRLWTSACVHKERKPIWTQTYLWRELNAHAAK